MSSYIINNGATSSSRIADLIVQKDTTDLKTTLESLTLILEATAPNVWSANLSYTEKVNNSIKVNDSVMSSIKDTLAVDISTTAWTLTIDYTAGSANPDLVLQQGVNNLTNVRKITLYFDKNMIHPTLDVIFSFI